MLYRSKIAFIFLLGFVIDLINMFIINAAYPTLERTFHVSVSQVAWAGNAYMLGLIVVIPLAPWLAQRLGERHLLALSLGIFSLGSLGAGLAPSFYGLVCARLLQGLGGGLLIPVGQAMAYSEYPPALRAKLTSLIMLVGLMVPALSPTIGGLVVDHLSWRYLFLAMLVPAAAVLVLVFCWLPHIKHAERSKALDMAGFVWATVMLVSLLLGLSWLGERHGIMATVALLIFLTAALWSVRHAHRQSHPLLDLHLLVKPLLGTSAVVYLCVPGLFTGVNLLATLYLQNEHGMSASGVGMLMLPWSAAAFVGLMTVRLQFASRGSKPFFIWGVLFHAFGVFLLASPWAWLQSGMLIVAYVLMGLGNSLCSSAAQNTAFLDIPHDHMRQASALWNINRQLSFSLGLALLSSLLNLLLEHASVVSHVQRQVSYQHCFLVAAVLTLAPLLLVFRLSTPHVMGLLRHETH